MLRTLNQAHLPYLVGGAFALAEHTGIYRLTKDLDIMVRPRDCGRVLALFSAAGYATEVTDPVWLAKVTSDDGTYLDVLFRSGNAVCEVDNEWFAHARPGIVMGQPVMFAPPEEIVWTKAFVMERDRYDGADVAHYFLAVGDSLDWPRLLRRFGEHWRVLLSHLVLFGFVYPGRRDRLPAWVMAELTGRLAAEASAPAAAAEADLCRGTLLSRSHYLMDVGSRGFRDPRFIARGTITSRQARSWKALAQRDRARLLHAAGLVPDPPTSPPRGPGRPR